MSRIVSLAMYDPGGDALERLWGDLRSRLSDAGLDELPDRLASPARLESAWVADDLLLAQTCGYPLRHALAGRVRYVGTPIYDVEGTEGAEYRSAIVVRAHDPAYALADLQGRRAAFNYRTSQSGYNAFRAAVAPLAVGGRFFGSVVETGSHGASLRAVIDNVADAAAIDPVSLALAPETTRRSVRILGWTDAAPGLPFITSRLTTDSELDALRRALDGFLNHSRTPATEEFQLAGFEVLEEAAYDGVLAMEQAAGARSYSVLN